MSPKLRVGYIRVSTASGEQLAALENQRSRVQATGVDQIIQDVQSGRDTDRAGYLQLLDLMDRRQLTEVVITRVDRLGRDAADTDAAIAFAAKRSVTITALDGGEIESQTPYGFVMSRIMTTMAEMESRMLSTRIKGGLREGRIKRKPLRGRAPWGYLISLDKTRFLIHPIEGPRARRFLSILKRCNWRMNTALDVWHAEGHGHIPLNSCRAVRAWLMNPILQGAIGYHQQKNHTYGQIEFNCHKALITADEYSTIESHLEQNRKLWGHNVTIRPRMLTSLCRCSHCKKSMPYAGSRAIPSVLCKTRGCPQQYRSTHESVIVVAINAELTRRADELIATVAEKNPEIDVLRQTIAHLVGLDDPDVEDAIARKRARLRSLEQRPANDPELLNDLRSPDFWTHYTYEELCELYHELVATVEIRDQRVEQVRLKL